MKQELPRNLPADKRTGRRYRFFFLGLYFFHVLHVLEEFWGNFRAVRIMGGELFLGLNIFFLALPLAAFVFILEDSRLAIRFGWIYAGGMILNGIGHGLALMISGRFFGFAAGAGSGLGLIIFGWLTFRETSNLPALKKPKVEAE